MLRGINKQRIFEDDQDYQKFLETIKAHKEASGYKIYAYCLMNNHIHLLMKEGRESLGIAFRRIGASYVYWYNWKYSRRGRLFQDRYKSEAVETDGYFLTVLRYIHQNPRKAKIAKEIQAYPWSSYREYTRKQEIYDIQFALSLFSGDSKEALSLLEKFNQENNSEKCLEYDDGIKLNNLRSSRTDPKDHYSENSH